MLAWRQGSKLGTSAGKPEAYTWRANGVSEGLEALLRPALARQATQADIERTSATSQGNKRREPSCRVQEGPSRSVRAVTQHLGARGGAHFERGDGEQALAGPCRSHARVLMRVCPCHTPCEANCISSRPPTRTLSRLLRTISGEENTFEATSATGQATQERTSRKLIVRRSAGMMWLDVKNRPRTGIHFRARPENMQTRPEHAEIT